MDQIVTRKILSNVQQVFRPNYNRVTWELSPIANMATDMTKSYFCFRMYITRQLNGARLTDVDYADLLSKNLMIEFGQNGFSYPAASLLKVARLYSRNNTGSPLEEILYQNVWATTMHQLTQDVETISSNTLSSGTAVSFNSSGSLAAQISALMRSSINPDGAQLPVEIHIPLSDIFGICKNSHFDMSLTGGLIMQIELEDDKNLFQIRSLGTPVPMPPLFDASGNGIPAQPELSPFTFLPDGQGDTLMPSYKFAKQNYDVSGNALLLAPNGYHYEVGTTLKTHTDNADCLWDMGDIFTGQQNIYLNGAWTAQNFIDAKFVKGNIVKLNFRLTYPNERMRSKMIEIYDKINTTESGEEGSCTIGLVGQYMPPIGITNPLKTDVFLESIDVYEAPDYTAEPADPRVSTFGGMYIGIVSSTDVNEQITPFEQFTTTNTLKVSVLPFQAMVDTGVVVLNGDGNYTGSGPFRLNMQSQLYNGLQVPWVDQFENADIPTQRQLFTNQGKPLSVQGTDTQILSVSAVDSSGNRLVTFKDLGFANNNSIQNATLMKNKVGYHAEVIGPTETFTLPNGTIVSDHILVWNILITNLRNKTALGLLQTDNYSFELDKCEVVLVEQTLDPSIPQTLTYETLRVEVATIETNILDTYNRQFTINEPSVFNCWLLTPQYSNSATLGTGAGTDPSGNHYYNEHVECLVSYARNVNQYRWAYNNIQNTNRPIEVQTNSSKYPSSLHLEKLMDTFSNTTSKMKNFSGIMTIPRTNCDPVVCFPLRIYEAIDSTSTYQREGGFTLQIALDSDPIHDRNIISGPIFLFKQMLKTIQG